MTSRFLELDPEFTIHYEESGKGRIPVLLLPGWTMSTRVFEHQIEYFSGSECYRFMTFDPRSHGLSSNTLKGHSYSQQGRDLHHFIQALDLDRIVLGGWSFGTLAALSYVNQFGPDRLSGFIMLDGPPRAVGRDNSSQWVSYCEDDRDGALKFDMTVRCTDRKTFDRGFVGWLFENSSEKSSEWLLDITRQTPDHAAADLIKTSITLDFRDDMMGLDTHFPMLYIVRKDRGEIVRRWSARNTPHARVEAFGEHMMFWERADEFNQVLYEYLEKCRKYADLL